MPFSLHATGTGKVNVGAAPSAEALLLCFSTCHGRHKDEKLSVFMEYIQSFKKSDGFQGQSSEAQTRYAKRNIPRAVGSCEHGYDLTASP